jgi:hypothetical protein
MNEVIDRVARSLAEAEGPSHERQTRRRFMRRAAQLAAGAAGALAIGGLGVKVAEAQFCSYTGYSVSGGTYTRGDPYVYCRSGPSTDCSVVTTLGCNTWVDYNRRTETQYITNVCNGAETNSWYKTTSSYGSCWISRAYTAWVIGYCC